MSKARPPASQPTPNAPAASPEPSSHSTLRIEPSATTATSTSSVLPSDSVALRRRPFASPPRDVTETPVRRSTPWSRCISAAIRPITPPSAPTSGPSPRSATVTARPSSRQTEATSEPMNPAPTIRTRRGPAASRSRSPAASSRVRMLNTPSSAASAGLNQGRARTPVAISRQVVRDPLAVGQEHLLGCPIQSGRRHPEPPLGVDRPPARQRGVVGRHRAQQDLLGERRAIVRLVRLVPDDGQLPPEALARARSRRRAGRPARRRR